MATSEEGQQVVLAETVQLDVPRDHHIVRLLDEDRLLDQLVLISSIAGGEEFQRRGDALRRVDETLAGWVFTELLKQLPNQPGNPLTIHVLPPFVAAASARQAAALGTAPVSSPPSAGVCASREG